METASRRAGKSVRRGDARIIPEAERALEAALRHGIDPNVVFFRPEPSAAERAAILIALERLLGATRTDPQPPGAWALAGRQESRSRSAGCLQWGWGRNADRLAGW